MCAIAGQIGPAADPAKVAAMLRAQAHRGPDGSGQWRGVGACLGANRLALLDRVGGTQPMVSHDGRYVLVYNGEVYNHAELRAELAGWPFVTRSDTEVVLAALVRWGADALPRLNGMFSLFFWDAHERRGWGARDRLGVKPFAYRVVQRSDGPELTFASEAKALVALDPAPRAHAPAVLEYLVAPMFSGVEHSPFAGIDYLPPGHMLRLVDGRWHAQRWWSYAQVAGEVPSAEELGAAVTLATERSLVADAPIGIFASGGLDSTLLLMAGRASLARAFTIAFAGQADFDYARSTMVGSDDEPFAELAARAAEVERELCPADPSDAIARLVRSNDALPAWEQELAQHTLARAAQPHVKAVLVGDAADELHWGYHFLLDEQAIAGPATILRRFGSVPVRPELLTDAVAHFDAHYRRLVGGEWGHTAEARRRSNAQLIVERWLPRLLHNGDIHTMAASVEARVPFADRDLVDLALRVGPSEGLAGGREKALLRASAKGRIPEAIRQRRKSALPKDQGELVADAYRAELARVLDRNRDFVGHFVDLPSLARMVEAPLGEAERAILFRVAALGHWAERYGVAV